MQSSVQRNVFSLFNVQVFQWLRRFAKVMKKILVERC